MSRAAAAENDHCNEPGRAEAAPARQKEQPRSRRPDQSRRADQNAAWRAGEAWVFGDHGRDEPTHTEPRSGAALPARLGGKSYIGRAAPADYQRLLLATMLLQLAVNKRRRREKSRIDRMTKCGVTKRRKAGRRTSRVKNGTAHNKIVTWRPASQEVAAEKSPKRQWGLPIAGNGSMCAEQLADYRAACDGKITWSAYFAKWGPRL